MNWLNFDRDKLLAVVNTQMVSSVAEYFLIQVLPAWNSFHCILLLWSSEVWPLPTLIAKRNEIDVITLFGASSHVKSWRKRQTGSDATAYAVIRKKNYVMEDVFTWYLDELYVRSKP